MVQCVTVLSHFSRTTWRGKTFRLQTNARVLRKATKEGKRDEDDERKLGWVGSDKKKSCRFIPSQKLTGAAG